MSFRNFQNREQRPRQETLTQQEFLIMLGEFRDLEPRINLFFQNRIAHATTPEARERLQRGQAQVMDDYRYLRDLASRDFGRRTVDWEDMLRDDQVAGRLERFRRFVETNQLSREIDRIGSEGLVDVARERDPLESLPLLPPRTYSAEFYTPEDVFLATAAIEMDMNSIAPDLYVEEKRLVIQMLHRLARVEEGEDYSVAQHEEVTLQFIALAYPAEWRALQTLLDSPFGNEFRQLFLGRPTTFEGTTMTDDLEAEIDARMANPLYIALAHTTRVAERGESAEAVAARGDLEGFYGEVPEGEMRSVEQDLWHIQQQEVIEKKNPELFAGIDRETREAVLRVDKYVGHYHFMLVNQEHGDFIDLGYIFRDFLNNTSEEDMQRMAEFFVACAHPDANDAKRVHKVFYFKRMAVFLPRLLHYLKLEIPFEEIKKLQSPNPLRRLGGALKAGIRHGGISREELAKRKIREKGRQYRRIHTFYTTLFKGDKGGYLVEKRDDNTTKYSFAYEAMGYLSQVIAEEQEGMNWEWEENIAAIQEDRLNYQAVTDFSDWRFEGNMLDNTVVRVHKKNFRGAQFRELSPVGNNIIFHKCDGTSMLIVCDGIKKSEEDKQWNSTLHFEGGTLDHAQIYDMPNIYIHWTKAGESDQEGVTSMHGSKITKASLVHIIGCDNSRFDRDSVYVPIKNVSLEGDQIHIRRGSIEDSSIKTNSAGGIIDIAESQLCRNSISFSQSGAGESSQRLRFSECDIDKTKVVGGRRVVLEIGHRVTARKCIFEDMHLVRLSILREIYNVKQLTKLEYPPTQLRDVTFTHIQIDPEISEKLFLRQADIYVNSTLNLEGVRWRGITCLKPLIISVDGEETPGRLLQENFDSTEEEPFQFQHP